MSTLKISACLNTQWLREEHNKSLNAAKEIGTSENIEELDKLRQVLEDKKDDVVYIGEDQDMSREQLKALQQIFNEYREKLEKGSETILVIQKYFK